MIESSADCEPWLVYYAEKFGVSGSALAEFLEEHDQQVCACRPFPWEHVLRAPGALQARRRGRVIRCGVMSTALIFLDFG